MVVRGAGVFKSALFPKRFTLISLRHGVGLLFFQIAIAKPIRFQKSKSKVVPHKLHYIFAMALPSNGGFEL